MQSFTPKSCMVFEFISVSKCFQGLLVFEMYVLTELLAKLIFLNKSRTAAILTISTEHVFF